MTGPLHQRIATAMARNDERPLDEECRKARKMERGASVPRLAGRRSSARRSTSDAERRDRHSERQARDDVDDEMLFRSGASMRPAATVQIAKAPAARRQNRAVAGLPRRRASSHAAAAMAAGSDDMAARDRAERRIQLLDEREQRPVGRDRASGDARRNAGYRARR